VPRRQPKLNIYVVNLKVSKGQIWSAVSVDKITKYSQIYDGEVKKIVLQIKKLKIS
jgi:hypothetical protein